MRTQPVALLLPLLLAACTSAGLPNGGPSAVGFVTVTVKAPAQAFGDKKPIKLTVWDAEQLAIADKTSNCSVSMDAATGKETVSCPPGVTYQKATPEEVTVTKAQLTAGFTFASKTLATGERYRIAVGGQASDDCNSAGGSVEGVASATTLNVEIKDIAQTMMACIPADQMPNPAGGIQAANNVTFTVNVDRTKFSNKKQITVGIYDPTMIDRPDGTPEETIVSWADLDKPLTITSSSVQVGERYELRVSGMAADGCNSASATSQGTAVLDKVGITFDGYAQTKMACLPTR